MPVEWNFRLIGLSIILIGIGIMFKSQEDKAIYMGIGLVIIGVFLIALSLSYRATKVYTILFFIIIFIGIYLVLKK
jgi:uncharacterized membrane protein YiaA